MGTAGHVDHGKTALVRALTGVDTDRWKEEKERGLTIDIGFARLGAEEGVEVGVIDVPGHEDFVKNMLAGSTGIDLLLLVVAAEEGPMPQTREHLAIARLLGVEHGIVALNKVDRTDSELLELARQAVAEELRAVLGHTRWPVVPVSAATRAGVDELRAEIFRQAAHARGKEGRDLFRMPVDRSFTIRGVGTVVTGTVWSGEVASGDRVRLFPGGKRVRVRSVEVHGRTRPRVAAGRRAALALVGVQADEAKRGSVIVSEGAWRPSRRVGVWLEVLAHAPRHVEHGQRVRLYLGTSEVMSRVVLANRDRLEPGQRGWAVLALETPVVARGRDRFVIRFYSPVTTIGGGRISALDPPRGWRERVGAWERCLDGTAEEAIVAAVRLAAGQGLADERLPIVTGLPADRLARPDARRVDAVRIGRRWFSREILSGARSALLDAVRRAHAANRRAPSVSLEGLRSAAAGRFAPALLERALDELVDERKILVDGPSARLPGHGAELTAAEERALAEVARAVGEGGLAPPTVDEIAARLGLDRPLLNDLLRLLLEREEIVALTPEIFLAAEEAENARLRARRLLGERGTAAPGDFKEAFGVSRKYLIPLMEFLDRTGVTRRVGEGRELVER